MRCDARSGPNTLSALLPSLDVCHLVVGSISKLIAYTSPSIRYFARPKCLTTRLRPRASIFPVFFFFAGKEKKYFVLNSHALLNILCILKGSASKLQEKEINK